MTFRDYRDANLIFVRINLILKSKNYFIIRFVIIFKMDNYFACVFSHIKVMF